jgi:hypothetical protein
MNLRELFTNNFIANILLHIGFISVLLGGLFFTLGSYVENTITTSQVQGIIDGYFTSYNLVTTPAQKAQFAPLGIMFNNPPDMSAEDAQVAAANHALLIKAVIVLAIIFVVSVGVAYYLSASTFMELLKENVVIVCFVALTEICFLMFIARNFRAVDPNYVKLTIVKALQAV